MPAPALIDFMEVKKYSTGFVVLTVAIAVVGVVVFHFFGNATRSYIDSSSTFVWWVSQWMQPDNEHGWIILAGSAFLYWKNLGETRIIANVESYWTGATIMSVALMLQTLSFLVQQTRISVLALLVFLVGAAYALGGRRWGWAAIFPAFLLLFSLPLAFIFDQIGFPMRMAVTTLAAGVANLLGFDVIRNGTELLSPDGSYQYDVAPACSGIRSLVSLMALSMVLGYMSFKHWGRRIFIFSTAIPYAFVGNVIRIFAIILAASLFGPEAGNFVHEWFGFLIFLIVLGCALLTVSAINRWIPEKKMPEVPKDRTHWKPEHTSPALSVSPSRVAPVAGTILAAGIFASVAAHQIDGLQVHNDCGIHLAENAIDPIAMPSLIGFEWAGQNSPVTKVEREVLPDDTGFSRKNYINLENRGRTQVFLSIVLSGKDRTSIHRPEICLRGQGWIIDSARSKVETFAVPAMEDGQLRATVLRIERTIEGPDGEPTVLPSLFAYWFVGGDTLTATHWERMATMAKDRVFGFKTHRWAYVVAQTNALDGEEKALARLETIIAETLPQFQKVGVRSD